MYVYSYGMFVCVKVLAFDETHSFPKCFWRKILENITSSMDCYQGFEM